MNTYQKTHRLYDEDGYATEFTAQVLSCEETKEHLFCVVLDQTLFFPEAGGQSPDKGTLDGVPVCDVQISDEVILHTLEAPLTVGSYVEGVIDWEHRFSNMQQHSGEHLFSGMVFREFGYHNVGFHLSDQIVTMDFDGVLSEEDIERLEWQVNEAIVKNVPIVVTYPSDEERKALSYRSKTEIEGQVRIVTIEGYDVCACCAPHVKRTGEIGFFKVMQVQNHKGGVRISILCGFRGLQAFREKQKVVSELTALLTTGQDKLPESVARLLATQQTLSGQLFHVRQELLQMKLEQIPTTTEHVILFEENVDKAVAQKAVNQLAREHGGFCGFFIGTDGNGYRYLLSSQSMDCRKTADLLRERLCAKGGGSEAMIQGSVSATKEQILATLGEQLSI